MRLRSRELFSAIHTEGGLLPGELLQRIADGDDGLAGLDPATYHLPPGERLNEAITRSWTRLQGAWRSFSEARGALPDDKVGAALTRERWLHPLFNELGYGRLVSEPAIEIEGKRYPVFSHWQNTPIHLVGVNVPLDRRTKGVAGASAQSPHSLVQELLNRSPERLWGMVSNGSALRLLRDNVALTRQSFVEFDLAATMEAEAYADFVVLWLTCHQSRVEGEVPSRCWLERWSQEAASQGTRALDTLREGVEEAIASLGGGFMAHPDNTALQAALHDGSLKPGDYYRQVLRLVYRLLFLFVAEDRNALLVGDDARARRRFADHYSTARLRRLSMRNRGSAHGDLFLALGLLMGKLHEEGCEPLALPALGSELWNPASIGHLADARIANADLLAAIRALAFVEDSGLLRPVDFRNLGAEELGSVYESLLELQPEIDRGTAGFRLRAVEGSERKTSGSYYTPTPLISALLDSALEPVLAEAVAGKTGAAAEAAILAIKVCDPACGSGHFLVAAANRIAKRLAAIRTGDDEPSPEAIRAALRDVVGRCLYGVDANPMAVELCKVSLWMEALEPGRPLSFLDHNIVHGNSLLGATPAEIDDGVPDAAYKPILGDDRAIATAWKKRNAVEGVGTQSLFDAEGHPTGSLAKLADDAAQLLAVDDRSLGSIRQKETRHRKLLDSEEYRGTSLAANAWCAAFVAPKRSGETPITSAVVQRALADPGQVEAGLRETIEALGAEYSFFHWHIAFPEVFGPDAGGRDGFDVLLGNPPWEHTELKEKEFFAERAPAIAAARSKAIRQRMIDALADEDPGLHREFEAARRHADGVSHLIRHSGSYPLCGRGRINTYAIFAEQFRSLLAASGRVGCIVPSGIAADDTTKLFFQDLTASGALISLFDFENRDAIFPAVHRSTKFCLLTLAGSGLDSEAEAEFLFFATQAEDLADAERRFTLTAAEIALLNPNTMTCPIFRTGRDAEITKGIHRRVPVLIDKNDPDGNPWGVVLKQGLFNMASDSGRFRTREELEGEGWELEGNRFVRGEALMLPLYEGKMFHQFDHRWAGYGRDGKARLLTAEEHRDPDLLPLPRYWLDRGEVEAKLEKRSQEWLLGWRDICRATDERTLIAGLTPRVAAPDNFLLALDVEPRAAPFFLAILNSFAADYAARQKVGGTHLKFFTMQQLPIPAPETLSPPLAELIDAAVLELVYTAPDLAPFAADQGYDGPPFHWDPERRALLRAELDAAIFHLYEIDRADIDYILDTFPIVRRKDEEAHGEYRTKRLILEAYDAMAAAGEEYEARLDPPPADPRVAHEAAAGAGARRQAEKAP
jgi:hypothetical protein